MDHNEFLNNFILFFVSQYYILFNNTMTHKLKWQVGSEPTCPVCMYVLGVCSGVWSVTAQLLSAHHPGRVREHHSGV